MRLALWALLIALSIQFIYIAFRFNWNYIFGLVTVIALVRDAAVMIGIYAIANRPADDAFLAAVLTVIGYSVMDTIVILDRIRENTKIMGGAPYETIVNESIKQTMTRSVNTARDGRHYARRFAAARWRQLEELRVRTARRHSARAPITRSSTRRRSSLVFRKRQLVAAERKRRESLSTAAAPSTGNGPSSASRGGSREDIVAARRARREKQKSTRPAAASPARYKRKAATAEIDPLDAQISGLHDEAFDAGHEEINLNLEGFDAPEHVEPHTDDQE